MKIQRQRTTFDHSFHHGSSKTLNKQSLSRRQFERRRSREASPSVCRPTPPSTPKTKKKISKNNQRRPDCLRYHFVTDKRSCGKKITPKYGAPLCLSGEVPSRKNGVATEFFFLFQHLTSFFDPALPFCVYLFSPGFFGFGI